jgi:sulfotransferase
MDRTYHFISGLPRSGSTLLSSILRQNPRFTTNISDPLHGYVKSILQITNQSAGMEAVVDIDRRRDLMRGLFDSFYKNTAPVCFNTNRGWSSETSLLKDLFPNFKMIVCLRDIPWILDSFEQLNSKNPHTIKPLYHHQDLGNVYDRTNMLMGVMPNFAGYVAGPLVNVKHSFYCNERRQIFYVEYDHLVKSPEMVMRQIYNFLGEEWYQHDFNNVEDSYDEFDNQAKISGLHRVRKKVEYQERGTILPADLWRQYEGQTYWKINFEQQKRTLNWSHVGNTTGKQL